MAFDLLADDALRQTLHQSILLGALVMARLIPMVQLLPFMGGQAIPQTVKMALALTLGLVLYPSIWAQGAAFALPDSTLTITALLIKELAVGATMGFLLALAFEALRMAGQIIDNTAGLTQATTMVPQLAERISPTSNFLYQFGIVIFFVIGGHHLFLMALGQSFLLIPPHEFLTLGGDPSAAALQILRLTAESITLACLMAFPVIAAITLTNLCLALVNKSAPQINVFFLGMPLKAVLASAIVLLSLDVLITVFADRVLDDFDDLIVLIHLLRGHP